MQPYQIATKIHTRLIIDLTCACASITGCDSHNCATVTGVARTAWGGAARMCGASNNFEAGGDIEGARSK